MSNSFCRFLSNGYSFNLQQGNLVFKPCCWYNEDILYDKNFELTKTHLNKISGWTPGCKVCMNQESAGYTSFRKSSFDIVDSDHADNVVTTLDINLDFVCNAACVICTPDVSTLWSKQLTKHKIIHIKPAVDFEDHLNKILELDLTHLRRVKFFGGEPLLTDTHKRVLERIPNPEQVDIWYTTNGSVLPDSDLINLWGKFKVVYFEVSIDGIDEQFDYIRWPLTWEKVERNLQELKQIAPANLLFRINYTANPLNILYYDRVEHWHNTKFSTNRFGDPTEINIHPCWGTWDLNKTPSKLRDLVCEKYGDHKISAMISNEPIVDYKPIMDFVDQWDPIRKQSWKSVFPEIVDYFT